MEYVREGGGGGGGQEEVSFLPLQPLQHNM